MSRWGKNIVVPLDSLCKEKENTNRPTVARSIGTVGKWGKIGFTSTRTYSSLSALHPMAAAAAAAAAAASPGQSPASTHDHDPNDMSVSVPEPPKPKKFFKSRNAAPPEVIAQIMQSLPHCIDGSSPMRETTGGAGGAGALSGMMTPTREPIKLKLAKSTSAERKRKSPKKKPSAAAGSAAALTTGALDELDNMDLDAMDEIDNVGKSPRRAASAAAAEPKSKKKKVKEEKKLKPEAPPSRILGRARKAVNYCEVDEDDRYPTPIKDLIIPKVRAAPCETITSSSAAAATTTTIETTDATDASAAAPSSPSLPPPATAPSAVAAAAAAASAAVITAATAAALTAPTPVPSTSASSSASRTPEHPPIVLRISKGTSRLVSTDSEEPPNSSPAQRQQQYQQQHHYQQQQQHLEALNDAYLNEVSATSTPKITVKALRPPPSSSQQQDVVVTSQADSNIDNYNDNDNKDDEDEEEEDEDEDEEEEEPPEINYCTVKISPDKPPKERLKLIIKTDVIRNAIAKAAAAAAAKAAGEDYRSGKKSKSRKHKHLKHAAQQQAQQAQAQALVEQTQTLEATQPAAAVTEVSSSEFKTPSPQLEATPQQQQQPQQRQASPTTRSEHDFDSQSSVLGSISSKGNSTPQLLAQAVQEDSCVIRSRGSSVITSDLETSQHSSLVAPPSDIESRLESMMMSMDGSTSVAPGAAVLAAANAIAAAAEGNVESPLQEDILAVLRGDLPRQNGGDVPAEVQPKRTARGRGRGRKPAAAAAATVAPAEKRTRGRGKQQQQQEATPTAAVTTTAKRATRTRGGKKTETVEMEVDPPEPPPSPPVAATVAASEAPTRRGRRAAAAAAAINNNVASNINNNNINKITDNVSAKAEATSTRSYGRKRKNPQAQQQMEQLQLQQQQQQQQQQAEQQQQQQQQQLQELQQLQQLQQVHDLQLPQVFPPAAVEATTDDDIVATSSVDQLKIKLLAQQLEQDAANVQLRQLEEDAHPTPAKLIHTEMELLDLDLPELREHDPMMDDLSNGSNSSSMQHDGSNSSPPVRDYKFKDKFKRTLTLDTQLAMEQANAAAAAAAAAIAGNAAVAGTAGNAGVAAVAGITAAATGVIVAAGVAATAEMATSSTPADPSEDTQRGAVKLVISKKKGSIFKSRALVPSDQAEQASVAKRHLYKHSWDAALEANGGGTGSDDASNASASTGAAGSSKVDSLAASKSTVIDAIFSDFNDSNSNNNTCSSSALRGESPGLVKLTRQLKPQLSGQSSNAVSMDAFDLDLEPSLDEGSAGGGSSSSGGNNNTGGGERTGMRVDRKQKDFYTVVRNVKTAHQIQEIGEYQEMYDDVEYILDALQPHNPAPTRCLSALQLATKCMTPAFRMHVRAHGVVTKFFKALSDANKDLSLGLCTSAIMYILSQEGLNMDLDRDSLELMINLLEAEGVTAPTDRSNYERNKQKVRELCEEIKAQGKATHLNVESITVGTLAMETLLSLTSKRAGEWFKEDLRKLGGLDHIIKTISDFCKPVIETDMAMISWQPALLDNIQTVARCLRVLENVTQHNEVNQRYMLTYANGLAVDTLCFIYRLCDKQFMLYPSYENNKEQPAAAMRELLMHVLKVLINLTHTFNESQPSLGAEMMGRREDVLETSFHLLLLMPNFVPDNYVFEPSILVTTLLINICMFTPEHVVTLMHAYAPADYIAENPPPGDQAVTALQSLLEYFYKCEELARLVEENTDAFLEAPRTDEVEETVNGLVQRAGHHMEHTLKGSYVGILFGCLIKNNEVNEAILRRKLRGNNFQEVIMVLEKYQTFMNVTTSSMEAAFVAHMKSTRKIIDDFKKLDYIYAHQHDEDDAMSMPLNLEMTTHSPMDPMESVQLMEAMASATSPAMRSTSSSSNGGGGGIGGGSNSSSSNNSSATNNTNNSNNTNSSTSSSNNSNSNSMPRVFKTYSSHR